MRASASSSLQRWARQRRCCWRPRAPRSPASWWSWTRVGPRAESDARVTAGMARVFITGSADGLGRLAAETLLDGGHEVVVHVRNRDRLAAVRDLVDRDAAAVVGDLADLDQ